MSFRSKLLLISLGPMALASLLLLAYSFRSFRVYFHDTSRSALTARARALETQLEDAVESKDQLLANILANRAASGSEARVRIVLPDGSLFASSDPGLDRSVLRWEEVSGIREALRGDTADGFSSGVGVSDERFYVALPVTKGGRVIGAVRLSLPIHQYQAHVRRNLWAGGAALLSGLVGAFLVCAILGPAMSTPIQRMSRLVERIRSGHLGETVDLQSQDEFGVFAAELNRMSMRLAEEDESRRLVLANLSHEFLTPVTNVQVTLEALKAGAAVDPESRDRFLDNAYQETERLKHLVNDSLDLTRWEAGVAPLKCQMCSLHEILDRCLCAVNARLAIRQIEAVVTGPDVEVHADADRLQQALIAILDNAVKHAPPASRITIRIEQSQNCVSLSVQDQGPGISQADLPRVFDPFFVGSPAKGSTSTGLGLAIAKRIIQAHSGAVRAASGPECGAEITVELPLNAVTLTDDALVLHALATI